MKIITCLVCGEYFSPRRTNGLWKFCECGRTGVTWQDGAKGLLRVTSLYGPKEFRVIGLNNSFFTQGVALGDLQAQDGRVSRQTVEETWRRLHDIETKEVSDWYLFHESHRSCWALIIRLGESSDVFNVRYEEAWAEYQAQRGVTHDVAKEADQLDQGATGTDERPDEPDPTTAALTTAAHAESDALAHATSPHSHASTDPVSHTARSDTHTDSGPA